MGLPRFQDSLTNIVSSCAQVGSCTQELSQSIHLRLHLPRGWCLFLRYTKALMALSLGSLLPPHDHLNILLPDILYPSLPKELMSSPSQLSPVQHSLLSVSGFSRERSLLKQ